MSSGPVDFFSGADAEARCVWIMRDTCVTPILFIFGPQTHPSRDGRAGAWPVPRNVVAWLEISWQGSAVLAVESFAADGPKIREGMHLRPRPRDSPHMARC